MQRIDFRLFDERESQLLKELQNILKGVESDRASVEQAAVILRESARVMQAISSTDIFLIIQKLPSAFTLVGYRFEANS